MEREKGYNERLYGTDFLRKFYHRSRFKFLSYAITKYSIKTEKVLEIGCGDAKSLEFLNPKPVFYVGIDANWEGLLDIAKKNYLDEKNYYFFEGTSLKVLLNRKLDVTTFDMAIAMEVFEHLTEESLEEYLKLLKAFLKGYLIVTVPVEIGPVFLLKHIVKRFFYKDDPEVKSYTLKEILYASIFKSSKVDRIWGGHKGFDYRYIIKKISNHYDIVEIYGIPFNLKPNFLNLTIGILAKNSSHV